MRDRAFAWLGILLGMLALGCSRERPPGEEGVSRTTEALSVVMTRTYGFESLSDWSAIYSAPTLALSTTHTEGQNSLAVSGGGWSSFISRTLAKEEAAPTVVGFDLRIPTSQPNPTWYGTVELFVDIPSRGINSQPLGLHMLTLWTPGQWRRAEFTVPAAVQTAMNLTYSDLRWRIQLNVPTNSAGQYLFDRFAFGGTPPACTPTSDGNACTMDQCVNGQVVHVPVPAGTSCTDMNACNGAEVCNAGGTCVAGTPVVCTASDQCHNAGTCDPATGACSNPAKPNGATCSDSNACTQTDTCQGGACSGGNPVTCVASDACHDVGTCSPATGVCSNPAKPDGASCADATVCNGAELCNAGSCAQGAPPAIDDGNPCTADSCHPVSGVAHAPVAAGTSCANGNACDGAETCNATGACVAGTPVSCVALSQCHDAGTCNPGTGVCSNPPKADGSACSDANACTTSDTCQSGACSSGSPVVCAATDACHAPGTCDPNTGFCSDPAVSDGTPCSDATVCNGGEVCSAGVCVAGAPIDVDDENPCTADGCDPVGGAFHDPVVAGTSCETDGNVCNGASACNGAGACQAGTPLPTDDSNPCTADACDPVTGVSHTPVSEGTSCDDATLCNGNETCNALGACLNGPPPAIDDQNPCTADACDAALGVTHTPLAVGTSCTNGNACDGAELCDAAGACAPGTPPSVDDGNPCTVDSCDPMGGVTHTPLAAGTSCADANVCNGMEICNGSGACTPGTPLDFADQNPCTADSCDPTAGATHTPLAAGTSCADSDICDGGETCDGAGSCAPGTPPVVDDQNPCTIDTCSPTSGVTHTPSPAGTTCADASVCNGAEACDGAGACAPGTPPTLSDDNPCTDDTCDPTTGVSHTPRVAGSSCNDFDLCNGNELCDGSGVCHAGTPVPIDTSNPCSSGTCDPLTGVVTYQPSPAGTDCFVDACTLGACNATGECTSAGSSIEDDGDPCTIEWCDPELGPQTKTCSAIDPTVGTTLHQSMKWLFEQPNPVQVGVEPGTIVVERATMLSGVVTTRDGSVLPGVRVAVKDHEEFGYTTTRVDGRFDMVINGGGGFDVTYEKEGYLNVHRTLKTEWGEYASLREIVMIQPDPVSTAIDLVNEPSDFQVARGTVQADEDGARQGTLLVPTGTQATMHLEDGSTMDLAAMNVRITEFTVGAAGPEAMPAPLPPESHYTHAFEVNADEAVAANAPSVTFSQPLIYYIDNFRQMPTGTLVPFGSFNRETGTWNAEESGIVLEVIAEAGGIADVDVTGDGVPDTGATLTTFGITEAERTRLADLYDPGQGVWRVRLDHFTAPYDTNWALGCIDCPEPNDPPINDPDPDDECEQSSASTIQCETQVLKETVPVAGTPLSLNYASNRVRGRRAAYQVHIPLTVPLLGLGVGARVEGLGRKLLPHNDWALLPEPNMSRMAEWDGKDGFGRPVQGAQEFSVTVRYKYRGCYEPSGGWAQVPPGTTSLACGGGSVNKWRERTWKVPLGPFSARELGLGGWTLDTHHVYEPSWRRLNLGDGSRRDEVGLPRVVQRLLPTQGQSGIALQHLAAQPDGVFYATNGSSIRRSTPSGTTNLFSGSTVPGYAGDGLPATDPSVRYNGIADIQLASDGSLIIADRGNHAIRKIGTDGIVRTIAGTGVFGHTGDGGPATQALLRNPRSLVARPDGSVFVAEERFSIRQIDPDGFIRTIAGGLSNHPDGEALPADGTPATTVQVAAMAVAASPDGTIYAAIQSCSTSSCTGGGVNRIIRINEGRVEHIAGQGCVSATPACEARKADGLDAKESSIQPDALAFDKFGQLFFIDGTRVRTLDNQGKVYTVAGRLEDAAFVSGGAARSVGMGGVDLTICPDGSLCVSLLPSNSGTSIITKVGSPLPAESGAAFTISSTNGQAIYAFDFHGRHLATKDALTGADQLRFTYDNQGRITAVTDIAGLVTQIERDSNLGASAIISPFGQRTELAYDQEGYLASVRDAEDNVTTMSYDNGLLTEFERPGGRSATMAYDDLGRLIVDADAADGSHTLVRSGSFRDWSVDRTTALGRTTSYQTEILPEGTGVARTIVGPSGLPATTTSDASGTTESNLPDGTRLIQLEAADPRFGVVSPLVSSTTILPSGLTSVETTTRQFAGLNPSDPLDFDLMTDQVVRNGRTWSTGYDPITRTFTTVTPAGRISTRIIDLLGRTTRTQVSGLARMDYQYDTSGRLLRTIHGTGALARSTDLGYVPSGSSAGYMQSITDALTVPTTFSRDALGRTLTESRAGATTAFSWDEVSNLASVTPPGKPTHGMTYTPVDLLESYDPPPAGLAQAGTSYTYDPDRMLRTETRPTGDVIVRTPDGAGRLDNVAFPGGFTDYEYYPAGTPSGAGKTSDIFGPYGVDLHFAYDGRLTTTALWTGDVTGHVNWQYNSDFNKIRETVTAPFGTSFTVFGYDNDQLLTCASPASCSGTSAANALRITRDPQRGGLITQMALGSTTETLSYNTFGEVARQTAEFSASPLVDVTYDAVGVERDKLGRITQKTEVVLGVTKVFGYTYDSLRRLTDVTVNGVLEEHFEYDLNGNRTAGFKAGVGTWAGTYDDQDRLLSYGPWTFTYTANGELETKTNTSTGDEWMFQYDVLGNLLSVGLPNGDLVEYLVDGMGRRVGKMKNGVLLKQWIYRDALKPVAELDGSGNLIAQFAYGSKSSVPDYVRRGSATYRVISDQLGSPRYVVNVSDAADVPFRAEHTSFGEAAGTGLDWMPFGFAGGIYDGDTGLVRFGARDYDAAIGRWAARDPIRWHGGVNLYRYANGDPVNQVDPTGRDPTHLQCTEMATSEFNACWGECYSFTNKLCDLFGGSDIDTCTDSCQRELRFDLELCNLTLPDPPPVEPREDDIPPDQPTPCWDWECYARR